MKHTNLGRTGLRVSGLCLGTMNFGWHAAEPESFKMMDRALDQGVNFFDTGDTYGLGYGEEIVAKALKDQRHEIMIGTPAIRNLIREGKIAQMYSAIQTGQGLGMQTLDQNLAELMSKGLINKEEARYRAVIKENF